MKQSDRSRHRSRHRSRLLTRKESAKVYRQESAKHLESGHQGARRVVAEVHLLGEGEGEVVGEGEEAVIHLQHVEGEPNAGIAGSGRPQRVSICSQMLQFNGRGGAGKRGKERGNLKKIEVAEGNLFSLTFFKQRMTSSSANSIFFKQKMFDKFECEI